MDSYILLDRSGSMRRRWDEAISSCNAYVSGLRELNGDGRVTLATFDSNTTWINPTPNLNNPKLQPNPTVVGNGIYNLQATIPTQPVAQNVSTFDILRNKTLVNQWNDIHPSEVQPRGGTPLFDATAKLVNLALKDNSPRAVLVIMTDGEENSSTEIRSPALVKSMLDECRSKGWQVVFLGADFDNVRQAAAMGATYESTISAVGGMGLSNATRSTAAAASQYFAKGTSMSYGAKDRSYAVASDSNAADLGLTTDKASGKV